nr:immunoglobulin light chain junction region [Mus musculus]
CLQYDELYTF